MVSNAKNNSQNMQFEALLEESVERVLSGEATLEDCLLVFPEHRDAVKYRLQVAQSFCEAEIPRAESGFKEELQDRFVSSALASVSTAASAAQPHSAVGGSRLAALRARITAPFRLARLSPRLALVAASLLMLMLMAGTAAAAQDSLPGSPLYPVKRLGEQVQLTLIRDADSKAAAHLRIAERRLTELKQLAEQRKLSSETAAALVTDAAAADRRASDLMPGANSDPEVRASHLRQLQVLDSLLARVPAAARKGLTKAIGSVSKRRGDGGAGSAAGDTPPGRQTTTTAPGGSRQTNPGHSGATHESQSPRSGEKEKPTHSKAEPRTSGATGSEQGKGAGSSRAAGASSAAAASAHRKSK